jgi:hypothetical protein
MGLNIIQWHALTILIHEGQFVLELKHPLEIQSDETKTMPIDSPGSSHFHFNIKLRDQSERRFRPVPPLSATHTGLSIILRCNPAI